MKLLTYVCELVLASALLLPPVSSQATPRTEPIIDGTLAPATDYPTVSKLDVGASLCTGTLIASKYVLTAAHCFFDDLNQLVSNYGAMQVLVNNAPYGVRNVTVHPTYVSRSAACVDGETDAAVVELASEPGLTPSNISRVPASVGTQLTLVGFGTQGTGSSGENGTIPPDGFLRFGTTSVEVVTGAQYVEWNFDNGESNTAAGDSGGPAFADINGARVVHSITCGGTGNAGFGTSSTNTRVDTLAAWIDSITGSSAPESAPTLLGLSPKIGGVGRAFSYTVQASGTSPIEFSFSNLPDGLTASGATISGTPTRAGTYSIGVTATNPVGSTSGSLSLTVTPFDPSTALRLRKVVVNLTDEDVDLVTLSGTIATKKGQSIRGQVFRVQIGGVIGRFTLNKNGKARGRGLDFVTLTNGKIVGGKITSKSVGFRAGLSDSDELLDEMSTFFPIDASDGQVVNLPVEISFGKHTFSQTIPMIYVESRDEWINQ